jgi:hypothetical protein
LGNLLWSPISIDVLVNTSSELDSPRKKLGGSSSQLHSPRKKLDGSSLELHSPRKKLDGSSSKLHSPRKKLGGSSKGTPPHTCYSPLDRPNADLRLLADRR